MTALPPEQPATVGDFGPVTRPTPDDCTNYTPAGYGGHWREWHRGHGCSRDPEVKSRVAALPPNPAPTGERTACAEWEEEGNEWVMCAGAFLLVVWVRECKDDAGNVTHGWRVNDGDDDVAFCAYTVPLTLEAAQLAAESAAAELLRAGLRALGCK